MKYVILSKYVKQKQDKTKKAGPRRLAIVQPLKLVMITTNFCLVLHPTYAVACDDIILFLNSFCRQLMYLFIVPGVFFGPI